MKKSVIVFSLILFKISGSSFSQVQADATKVSGFHLGISHIDLREESLNRAIHQGPGLMGSFYLQRSNARSVKVLHMELGSNFLKSDFEEETSSYLISGSASFSYLRTLVKAAPGFSFSLGGKVEAGSNVEYFDNWDESHFYWLTSYALGTDLRATYAFRTNSRIAMEVDFPLLSLISRPPERFFYTQSSPAFGDVIRELNQDLRFVSPGAYRNFNLEIKYSFGIARKFVPAMFWRFSEVCIHRDGWVPMKYISQTIGIEYRF